MEFLQQNKVDGEDTRIRDLVLIDTDGEGEGDPFTVKCTVKETVIDKPTVTGR